MSSAARVDAPAVRAGILGAAIFAVPAGVVNAFVDGTGWLVVVVLVGLLFGAAVAAYGQRLGTPLVHGIVTALGVFVAVQVLGIVRRATAGDDIAWGRIVGSLFLTVLVGLLGGLGGGALRDRMPPRSRAGDA